MTHMDRMTALDSMFRMAEALSDQAASLEHNMALLYKAIDALYEEVMKEND